MRVLVINGSPRKNMNTMTLLQKAVEEAEKVGAECEIHHLYDYEYTGCKSCFACKIKGSRTNGVCAVRDGLRPLLEKILQADAVILGTPVYYDNISGMMRSFLERLLYPVDSNKYDENRQLVRILRRKIPFGVIYTMNAPERYAQQGYAHVFQSIENRLTTFFGSCDAVFSYDTYQFHDYGRYDAGLFSEERKAEQRKTQWPVDCENARILARTICDKASKTVVFEEE